jgi:hypothetical protein
MLWNMLYIHDFSVLHRIPNSEFQEFRLKHASFFASAKRSASANSEFRFRETFRVENHFHMRSVGPRFAGKAASDFYCNAQKTPGKSRRFKDRWMVPSAERRLSGIVQPLAECSKTRLRVSLFQITTFHTHTHTPSPPWPISGLPSFSSCSPLEIASNTSKESPYSLLSHRALTSV